MDGTLPPIQREYVRRLLEQDPRYRDILEDYRALYSALSHIQIPERVPGFADRVMDSLPTSARQSWSRLRISLVATAALFAAVLALLLVPINWQPVVSFVQNLSLPGMDHVRASVMSALALLGRFSDLLPYALASLLTIMFYSVLDHVLRAARRGSQTTRLL
jgi:anti-sigma factor RsiW